MARFAPLPKPGFLENSTTEFKEIIVFRIFGALDGWVRFHKRSQILIDAVSLFSKPFREITGKYRTASYIRREPSGPG